MNDKIKNLAVDAIVENPAVDAWVFTDKELEQFSESIIKECAEVAWCNFHADGAALFKLIPQHFEIYDIIPPPSDIDDVVYRLRKRAEIRRQIPSRKSVQEGKPDRIADLLEEAANEIQQLRNKLENT